MERLNFPATTLAAAIFLFFSSDRAQACGFAEIVAGDCPSLEVETDLDQPNGSPERYAIDPRFLWTKWPGFKEVSKKGALVLNVCIFKTAPAVITDSGASLVAFSDDETFAKVVKQVESAAAVWSSVNLKQGTLSSRSRLSFAFKDSDGRYMDCETAKDPHILIAINSSSTNYSAIGPQNLSNALTGAGHRRATMTLSVSNRGFSKNKILPDAATHEFGHALGFLHEMAHFDWSACGDAFDATKYVDESGYTFGTGYTRDKMISLANSNIAKLAKSYKNIALSSEKFDRVSIMTYKIDAKYFGNNLGEYCSFTKNVKTLSALDIQGYLGVYGETF